MSALDLQTTKGVANPLSTSRPVQPVSYVDYDDDGFDSGCSNRSSSASMPIPIPSPRDDPEDDDGDFGSSASISSYTIPINELTKSISATAIQDLKAASAPVRSGSPECPDSRAHGHSLPWWELKTSRENSPHHPRKQSLLQSQSWWAGERMPLRSIVREDGRRTVRTETAPRSRVLGFEPRLLPLSTGSADDDEPRPASSSSSSECSDELFELEGIDGRGRGGSLMCVQLSALKADLKDR